MRVPAALTVTRLAFKVVSASGTALVERRRRIRRIYDIFASNCSSKSAVAVQSIFIILPV